MKKTINVAIFLFLISLHINNLVSTEVTDKQRNLRNGSNFMDLFSLNKNDGLENEDNENQQIQGNSDDPKNSESVENPSGGDPVNGNASDTDKAPGKQTTSGDSSSLVSDPGTPKGEHSEASGSKQVIRARQ